LIVATIPIFERSSDQLSKVGGDTIRSQRSDRKFKFSIRSQTYDIDHVA